MYKNLAILFCISLLSIGKVFSQEGDFFYVDPDEKGALDMGVRMGVALNSIGGGIIEKPIPIVKFSGGVYHRFPINKNSPWSIYYELSFSFKGARYAVNQQSPDSLISRLSFIYFDFPIGLDYKIKESKNTDGGKTIYRIFMGIQPSYLARSTLYRNFDVFNERQGRVYGAPLKRMDYALVLGLPIEFPVGFSKMGVTAFFKYGLRDINRDMDRYASSANFVSGKPMNNWQFSLNLTF